MWVNNNEQRSKTHASVPRQVLAFMRTNVILPFPRSEHVQSLIAGRFLQKAHRPCDGWHWSIQGLKEDVVIYGVSGRLCHEFLFNGYELVRWVHEKRVKDTDTILFSLIFVLVVVLGRGEILVLLLQYLVMLNGW